MTSHGNRRSSLGFAFRTDRGGGSFTIFGFGLHNHFFADDDYCDLDFGFEISFMGCWMFIGKMYRQ